MDEPLKMGSPIVLSAEAFDWLVAWLDEPPRDCPKLRKLFKEESRFTRGEDETNPRTP